MSDSPSPQLVNRGQNLLLTHWTTHRVCPRGSAGHTTHFSLILCPHTSVGCTLSSQFNKAGKWGGQALSPGLRSQKGN